MFGNAGQTRQFGKFAQLTAYVIIKLNIKFLYTEMFKFTYSMLERQYSPQSVIVDFSFTQFMSVFVDRQYSLTLLV